MENVATCEFFLNFYSELEEYCRLEALKVLKICHGASTTVTIWRAFGKVGTHRLINGSLGLFLYPLFISFIKSAWYLVFLPTNLQGTFTFHWEVISRRC